MASIRKRITAPSRDAAIVVVTHAPDRADPTSLANALQTDLHSQCLNIGAAVHSIYHWQGGIETATEVPLAIKTRSALYSRVEDVIRTNHTYDTPEIIAIPIVGGEARYLDWIAAETSAR
jgi:periplasmic divalent cation tolerance protein